MLPHIVMLVPRPIYPAASGGELRVLSLLSRLSGRYRFSLLMLAEPGREKAAAAAALHLEQGTVARVRCVPPASPESIGMRAGIPDYARPYSSPAMSRELRRLLREDPADLVDIEFSEMGAYAFDVPPGIPRVFTEHDTGLLSRGRSYLREDREEPPAARPAKWRRRRAFQRRVLSRCQRVVVLSEADRSRLSCLVPRERISVVPQGVDIRRFRGPGPARRQAKSLLYLGCYAHYPNEDAAVFLCRSILPRLRRLIPGVKTTLLGSAPTPQVEALACESVRVTGTVADVRPYLASTQVFVAPVRLGHGFKGKLLEAFASGTPVVATPQACEGIPELKDGEHLLMAQGPAAFARQTAWLMRRPELRRKLARNALRLVQGRYGWDLQARRLSEVYDLVLGER